MASTAAPDPSAADASPRALDGGRVLAGIGALALLFSLFLDWYGQSRAFDGVEDSPDAAITAWTAFELIDILLAGLAIATLLWVTQEVIRSNRSVLPARFGSVAGPLALALVLVSIVNEPPLLSVLDPEREAGIWVGLVGAALMTIGALLRVARISLVVSPREGASPGTPASDQTPAPEHTPAEDPAFPEADTRTLPQEPGLQPPPR